MRLPLHPAADHAAPRQKTSAHKIGQAHPSATRDDSEPRVRPGDQQKPIRLQDDLCADADLGPDRSEGETSAGAGLAGVWGQGRSSGKQVLDRYNSSEFRILRQSACTFLSLTYTLGKVDA
jgi:hypothetical protein